MSDGGSTPKQYGIPEGASELQDLIEYRDMNFAIGNIFKACYRIGTKNNDLYELNKIYWFAKRERDRLADNDEAPILCGLDSVNKLLENTSALCLQAVATGKRDTVMNAIAELFEASEKMIEIENSK